MAEMDEPAPNEELISLNEFEDADFAKYPAIEITQTHYTIGQYEAIANTLIGVLASGDPVSFPLAARAMASLAYNTLMEPDHMNLPFFHRYGGQEWTEEWLATSDDQPVDLAAFLEPRADLQVPHWFRLELNEPNASNFQRKSSIGVWAFCHLRAFGQVSRWGLLRFFEQFRDQRGTNLMTRRYGFPSSYRFPSLAEAGYGLLKDEYKRNRNTEILYLFYRATIIFERNLENPRFGRQREELLESLAYGGSNNLRYGGLWFFNSVRQLAVQFRLTIDQFCADLEWALAGRAPSGNIHRPQGIVKVLRQFHHRYGNVPTKSSSRYFMYAHLVDDHFFYWLGSRRSLELTYAISKLAGNEHFIREMEIDEDYKVWGEQIAARLLERYKNRARMQRW